MDEINERYISINDIIKCRDNIRETFAPLHNMVIDEFINALKQLPVIEIRYGEWIPASNKPDVKIGLKCSECGARIRYRECNQHNYCYKCGAKMRVSKCYERLYGELNDDRYVYEFKWKAGSGSKL